MPHSVVRFPIEQSSPPSSDIDALFLSTFLQLNLLYTYLGKHAQSALTEDSSAQVADLMTGLLDAWEAKRATDAAADRPILTAPARSGSGGPAARRRRNCRSA